MSYSRFSAGDSSDQIVEIRSCRRDLGSRERRRITSLISAALSAIHSGLRILDATQGVGEPSCGALNSRSAAHALTFRCGGIGSGAWKLNGGALGIKIGRLHVELGLLDVATRGLATVSAFAAFCWASDDDSA